MKGWILYLLLAVAVAFSFLARFYDKFPGDVSVITWIQSWESTTITSFMEIVSLFGTPWFIYGLACAAALSLFVLHRRQEFYIAIGTIIILSLSPILKWLVDRPRPPEELYSIGDSFSGLGFPSGHAYHSFVLFCFFFYLTFIFISKTWLRRAIQALLVLLVLAIGISRVYLGAHWPSDVLGAYLLGGSCMGFLLHWRCCGTETAIEMSRYKTM